MNRTALRIVSICLLLIVGAGVGLLQAYHRSGGGLRISKCSDDVGVILSNTSIARTFHITNAGRSHVHIDKVSSSKGSRVTISNRDLERGKTVALRLEAPVRVQPGPLQVVTAVHFRGRPRPTLFRIKGTVVEAFPRRIEVGEVLRGQTEIARYDVHPEGVRALVLRAIQFPPTLLTATAARLGNQLRISVAVDKDAPSGSFQAEINVETNDPVRPRKTTIIAGRVLAPVVARPDYASLGVFSAAENVSKQVALISPYGRPFAIGAVVCTVPEIDIRWTMNRRVEHSVTVASNSHLAPGPVSGEIRVTFSDNKQRVTIPVYGLRRKSG